jgi:hypothetical protein
MATVMIRPMTIGAPPAESHAADAQQDGERIEPVGAGMQSVGVKSSGPDSAPDADAVAGDELVPGETYRSRQSDCQQMADRTRARQPRLPPKAAAAQDTAMSRTMMMPARSSARP